MWLFLLLWLLSVLASAGYKATDSLRFQPPSLYARLPPKLADKADCRVLIVGSSPAVFGLSAEQIRSETGCPSANLAGLSIGIQLTAYVQELSWRLRPGDYVVLSDWCWIVDCGHYPWARKFLHHLKVVPALGREIRTLFQAGDGRSPAGDLVTYQAPMQAELMGTAIRVRATADAVALASVQLALITKSGAVPILAPPPFLVGLESQAEFRASLLPLSSAMQALVGKQRWIEPAPETDGTYFVDGLHSSPSGRARWTRRVVDAIRASQEGGSTSSSALDGRYIAPR
jgi:hypothetical protein